MSSCCGKEVEVVQKSNMLSIIKILLPLLHLSMLAVFIFGDGVELIENNLMLIISVYGALFIILILFKTKKRKYNN